MHPIKFIAAVRLFNQPFRQHIAKHHSFEERPYSESWNEPATYDEEELIHYDNQNLSTTTPQLLAQTAENPELQFNIMRLTWRQQFFAKLPKLFKRHMWNQFIDLKLLKTKVLAEFGEVEEKFRWMQRDEQQSICDVMRSYKLPQKKEFMLQNFQRNTNVQFSLVEEDFYKLFPYKDLNDSLIQSYIKILRAFIFPEQTTNSSYVFSSFLLSKLIGDMVKQPQDLQSNLYSDMGPEARALVRRNFYMVERWNKKIDIFEQEVLIFPINMISHWFCVIVYNPGSLIKNDYHNKCLILFCDSMFESRFFVVQTIREYLKLQLQRKRQITVQVTSVNAPSFQMLLPRQTNSHDCGLYMLAYIEQLLLNKRIHFQNLNQTGNRNKLQCFPKMYMHSLRQRIMKLFIQLYQKQMNPQRTNATIKQYLQDRQMIYQKAVESDDFCTLDMDEFRKYLMFANAYQKEVGSQDEARYRQLVRFNLLQDINYYEKDAPIEEMCFDNDEDSQYK